MTKNSILVKWGLIGSLAYLILGVLGHLMSLQVANIMSYLFGILIAIPILFASFEYRDKFNEGFATLPQIFILGLKLSSILALTVVFWCLVYASFINTNYVEEIRIKNKLELIKELGIEGSEIDARNKLVDQKGSPLFRLMIIKLINTMVFGIFVSLVSGLVLRNEEPRAENIQKES